MHLWKPLSKYACTGKQKGPNNEYENVELPNLPQVKHNRAVKLISEQPFIPLWEPKIRAEHFFFFKLKSRVDKKLKVAARLLPVLHQIKNIVRDVYVEEGECVEPLEKIEDLPEIVEIAQTQETCDEAEAPYD